MGSVSDLISVHDSRGRVLYVTPSVGRFMGASVAATLTTTDAIDVIHRDDCDRFLAAFAAWSDPHAPVDAVRYRARHADGTWRELEAVGHRFTADDCSVGVVVTSRDCTFVREPAGTGFANELLLQRAIERNEFVVYYQPELDVATGELLGFEALARWADPNRGIIAPDAFIGLAETTGLIVPLGRSIMGTACAQMAELHGSLPADSPRPWLSVNVSGRQLTRPGFVEEVAGILAVTGLDADTLWLEITETALMEDLDASKVALDRLRAIGVHLAIDDFGTGWSSLAYLKRFPVEQLKIDGSFTAGVGRDAEDTSIITAIVAMAHSLKISVVAECVETTTQLAALTDLHCDVGQGYLWSRPMPFDEVHGWIHPQHRRGLSLPTSYPFVGDDRPTWPMRAINSGNPVNP